jgi:hypothetical protein
VTGNLPVRGAQHKARAIDGFTKTYGIDRLVWFERHETVADAILREPHPCGLILFARNCLWANGWPSISLFDVRF